MIQGRELGEGDLALIWTLATEPSEWGRTRLSAKVVRPVPCAEGASPDSGPAQSPLRKGHLLTQSRTVRCPEGASPDSDPHRGLCGPLWSPQCAQQGTPHLMSRTGDCADHFGHRARGDGCSRWLGIDLSS